MMDQASIVYALVANHQAGGPLVDVAMAEGNYHLFALKVLAKVNLDFTMSMTYRSVCTFHYHDSYGYTFLCLSDADYPETAAHCFLREVKTLFYEKYGDSAHDAISFSASESFEPILRERMIYYNSTDHLETSSEEVLHGRLEDILEEPDLVDIQIKKTNELTELYEENKRMKQERVQKQKQVQVCLGVMTAIAMLVFVIVTIACGGFDYNVCGSCVLDKSKNF